MSVFFMVIFLSVLLYGAYQSFGSGGGPGKNIPIHKLNEELEKNVQKGVISVEQSQELKGSFEKLVKPSKLSLITVISTLGAMLFGLGVILFATSNWEKLSTQFKVTLITLLMVLFYFIGYYIAYKKKSYPIVGKILIFLGSLVYGGDLFLINTSYNMFMESHFLVLAWAMGLVPLCFAFEELLVPILFSVLITVWNFMYMDSLNTFNLWYLLLFTIGIYFACRLNSGILYIINIVGIFGFYIGGITTANLINSEALVVIVLAILSILLYCIGKYFSRKENYKFEYINGILFFLVINLSFFLMTYDTFNKGYIGAMKGVPSIVLGITLLSTAYLFITLPQKELLIKVAVCIPIYIVVLQYAPFAINVKVAIGNILFPIFVIWSLNYGYRMKEMYIFIISLITFIVEIIARYFDYFFTILPRSLFFVLGGAILIIGGITLEKKRNLLKEEREEKS